MQIGRFFSLGQGYVGQYLSPRVLVVRSPFNPFSAGGVSREFCCFGFGNLKQAQTFIHSLSYLGLAFKLRESKVFKDCAYEVILRGHSDLARTLAFWERRDLHQLSSPLPLAEKQATSYQNTSTSTPAIAA